MKTKCIILLVAFAGMNLLYGQKSEKNSRSNIEDFSNEDVIKLTKDLEKNPSLSFEYLGNDKVISTEDYWIEEVKGKTVRFDTSYIFNSKVHIISTNNKDLSRFDIYGFFNDTTSDYYAEAIMIDKKGKNIMKISALADGNDSCYVGLVEVGSSTYRMADSIPKRYGADGNSNKRANKEVFEGKISDTGLSQLVAGYKCKEYILSNNEGKLTGKIWVTIDTIPNIHSDLLSKSRFINFDGYETIVNGIILAEEMLDEQKGSTVTEVKEVQSAISHSVPANKFYNRKNQQITYAELRRTFKCQSGKEVTVPILSLDKRVTAGMEWMQMTFNINLLRMMLL